MRFAHCAHLLVRVEDEQRVRQLGHGTYAGEVAQDAPTLARIARLHLLRLADVFRIAHVPLDLVEAADGGADGLEVGERAAQPTFRHIGHACAAGGIADDVAGLALGADEQHGLVGLADLGGIVVGLDQTANGLLDIDDVDGVALAEDVRLHARVPHAGGGSKMDAGFQQFLDIDDGHDGLQTPSTRRRGWEYAGDDANRPVRRTPAD